MTNNVRNEKNNICWLFLTNVFVSIGCFIMLASIWIKKTYGELLLAVVDSEFRNFFQNKRSLFLVRACVPTVCIFVFFLLVEILLLKSRFKKIDNLKCKSIALLGVFVLFSSIFGGGIYLKADKYVDNWFRKQKDQWYDDNQIVMHALGMIDGHTYTNSYEALVQNYVNGNRVFECDLVLTSDNELVACHDWDRSEANGVEGIPTKEEFMNAQIMGKYTPMSIDDIILFMKEHPDVYVITDTKSAESEYYAIQFQEIVDAAIRNDCKKVLNRFVIQIYHPYMYIDINNIYHFDNWIFTLYQEGYRGDVDKMKEYAEFCIVNGIDVITMNKDYYNVGIAEVCDKYGVHLFVHTVKDEEQKKDFLLKNIGIYVDE